MNSRTLTVSSVTSRLLQAFPYTPTSGQIIAIEKIASFICEPWDDTASLFILKGYAGTGKTTLVSAIVNSLPAFKKRTVLMAPTGRAAKVLNNYTQAQANTIHRKIYFARTTREGVIALRLQANQHKQTLFLVDEASMIQNSSFSESTLFSTRNLLDDLFQYVFSGDGCKVMFIGDGAQLPPVGSDNSPALDMDFLKRSYHLQIDYCELTEVVRQAYQSGILVNATMVRKYITKDEWSLPLFSVAKYPDVIRLPGSELEDALNSAYSRANRENNAVVCRSNKRANLFNREIRKRVLYLDGEISVGDFLMVVKNNYFWLPENSQAGFMANGDIVELTRIRKTEEMYGFRFADVTFRFVDYLEEKELDVKILLDALDAESAALSQADNNRLFNEVMKDYEHIPNKRARIEQVKINPYFNAVQVKFAYAFTCHKTQGGQWETVFIDQGYLSEKMMNIEFLRWLYTAVTRATKKLYLINFDSRFFFDD